MNAALLSFRIDTLIDAGNKRGELAALALEGGERAKAARLARAVVPARKLPSADHFARGWSMTPGQERAMEECGASIARSFMEQCERGEEVARAQDYDPCGPHQMDGDFDAIRADVKAARILGAARIDTTDTRVRRGHSGRRTPWSQERTEEICALVRRGYDAAVEAAREAEED